jgi:hypothetical protein
VPGFWRISAGTWSLAGSDGLLIPCRDPAGLIRGLRIRPDDPGTGGKYRWLSSASKTCGTGSGVHSHVARPRSGRPADSAVWITEGELKADQASERIGAIVVSLPGVASWRQALSDMERIEPGTGRIVLALDADWRTNPHVHAALWALSQTCRAVNREVRVAIWNVARAKGLDDLLSAGGQPEIRPVTDIPPPEWLEKLSSLILVGEQVASRTAAPISLDAARAQVAAVQDGSIAACRSSR